MNPQDYDMNEGREEYIKRMALEGMMPSYPACNELQIDIDNEAQYANFEHSFFILSRDIQMLYNFSLTPEITPSRSGFPSRHIRIKLPFEVGFYERIAWQASLGSDPIRELLSCLRAHRGSDNPTLLMEADPSHPKSQTPELF